MTIHRAYGHIDRASVREGGPLRVVMASEGRQGDGIDLRMSGAQLERFKRNPVLGYGHRYYGRENLPIGRVNPDSITVEGTRTLGDLEFDPADEFAQTVERKLRDGFLNAVSIGFEVTKWEGDKGDTWRGGVAEEWELHELSVVPVPMDAAAVVESGRSATGLTVTGWRDHLNPPCTYAVHVSDATVRDNDLPSLALAVARALQAERARLITVGAFDPPAESPEDPEPAPEAGFTVSNDAARALLAAFAKES